MFQNYSVVVWIEGIREFEVYLFFFLQKTFKHKNLLTSKNPHISKNPLTSKNQLTKRLPTHKTQTTE